jgi:hypothetical protein
MGAITIIIKNGVPATGFLDLGKRVKAKAKQKDVITWCLGKKNTTVKSIYSILVKPKPAPPSPNIWSIEPQLINGWKGTVDKLCPDAAEWNYNIEWMDMNNIKCTYDPKIIVNSKK